MTPPDPDIELPDPDVETGGELNHTEEVVPLPPTVNPEVGNLPGIPVEDTSAPEYPEQEPDEES